MSRTSDRTLLQALGFNDPDKGNEEHDLACRFLVQPATMEKLVGLIWAQPEAPFFNHGDGHKLRWEFTDIRFVQHDHRGSVEQVVQRDGGRSGAYHIGFLDAEIQAAWTFSAVSHRLRPPTEAETNAVVGSFHDWLEVKPDDYLEWTRRRDAVPWVEEEVKTVTRSTFSRSDTPGIGIEVKIGHVPIGQAIRQIKLYASYKRHPKWVLATRYAISQADREALAAENIMHIRLAGGFDAYLDELKRSPASDSPEL